ncbi:MAG: hypothetical protein MI757_19980 [Pirellulales bacterium]|nr:hypothetical protein [Pirellulales bacterium]
MSKQLGGTRTALALVVSVSFVAAVAGGVGVLVGSQLAATQPDEADANDSKVQWPSATELMASASASGEGFSMATGAVDDDVEGLFILDHLTGDLRGLLLNVRTGKFNSFYQYNVVEDLGTAMVKNPKYVLLTGGAAFRDGIGSPRTRLSRSAVYVAELDSGVVAAYAVPWAPGHQQFGRTTKTSFIALDRAKFRDIPLRDQ